MVEFFKPVGFLITPSITDWCGQKCLLNHDDKPFSVKLPLINFLFLHYKGLKRWYISILFHSALYIPSHCLYEWYALCKALWTCVKRYYTNKLVLPCRAPVTTPNSGGTSTLLQQGGNFKWQKIHDFFSWCKLLCNVYLIQITNVYHIVWCLSYQVFPTTEWYKWHL